MSIKFGIVGPGKIADRSLAPAIGAVDGARLWSVTSRSLSRAEEFATKHGASGTSPAFDDYEAMLDDPSLDAVVISTPDKLHGDQGIVAANAGKHVFMEKPMTASSEEGQRLLRACNANGVKLGVAYHLRWHRGHRKLVERVHGGEIGKIHHARHK